MSEVQDQKIAELERELEGLRQMLYHVLDAVGEPVIVTKKRLAEGITGDKMISVDENMEEFSFIFHLVDVEGLNEQ